MTELPPGLLTMRQAEQWLAMKPSYRGRRLRRILQAIERRTGREVITRLGERGDRVTRSALRRYAKHLLPSNSDELRERFAQFLRNVDAKVETAVSEHVASRVEPELEDLRDRADASEEALRELGRRQKRLAEKLATGAAEGRQGPSVSPKGEAHTRGRSDRPSERP